MSQLGSGSSRGSLVNHVGLSESLQYCENVQHMIEINADHLERLRASSASIGHLYSAGSGTILKRSACDAGIACRS